MKLEDLVARHNDLEVEVSKLKEVISKLCSRVLFLESFIKQHHGDLSLALGKDIGAGDGSSYVPLTFLVNPEEESTLHKTWETLDPPSSLPSLPLESPLVREWLQSLEEHGNGFSSKDITLQNSKSKVSKKVCERVEAVVSQSQKESKPGKVGTSGTCGTSGKISEDAGTPPEVSQNLGPPEVLLKEGVKEPEVPSGNEIRGKEGKVGEEKTLSGKDIEKLELKPILEAKTPILEAKAPVSEAKAPVSEAKTLVSEAKTPILEAKTVSPQPYSVNISEPSEVKCLPVRPTNNQLVDIGLQTDLEEDPEIYYFAGGRHVLSQTDYSGEYEPLIPFVANTKLEIIVLNNSPPGNCISSTNLNENPAENNKAAVEAAEKERDEAKSNEQEKDEWKTVTGRSNRSKWSQSSSSLGSGASLRSLDRISFRKGPPPTPTTVPKRRVSNPPREVANKGKPVVGSTKGPEPLSGRNSLSFLKSRYYQPSSTISLPVLNGRMDEEEKRSAKNVKGVVKTKNQPSLQQRSTQTSIRSLPMASAEANIAASNKTKEEVKRPLTSRKPLERQSLAARQGLMRPPALKSSSNNSNSTVVSKDSPNKTGTFPAKKLATTSSGAALSNQTSVSSRILNKPRPLPSKPAAKPSSERIPLTKKVGKTTPLASSASSVSEKLSKKTQPSKKDLGEDLELSVDSGLEDKWKEDTESSNDDEEIEKKEAALESAFKESELLEEELLQVEKDFEEIELRATNGIDPDEASNRETSSPSTFPESETETEVSDCCSTSDLDQFFFIAISNENLGGLATDEKEERIVAKKEKLRLSPAKKCDSAETWKRHLAKLAKAERNREKLLQAKYNRYVELSERFASLNESTKKLVEERTELIAKAEDRRKRAAEKRELHLKSIVKKAHDEDSKAKEIAFINYLEAQNKRHDYLANVQEVEDRLNSIQQERKLKLEDRAVKVQAVIDRQDFFRHNWEMKLAAMQEKRRKIDERIIREREERAKERSEIAQERARDREERISALNAAKQAEKEELQKKIQQKQEETARRHDENIEQIRQKAIELTLPRTSEDHVPPTVRICTLCKVTMQSEVQQLAHLRCRTHLDSVRKMEQENGGTENFGLKFITDVQADKVGEGIRQDKNRSKKHCKKIMLKLTTGGEEFEKLERDGRVDKPWGDPTLKAKVVKNLRELERSVGLFSAGKGSLSIANSMDKLLADVRRTINKNKSVQDAVIALNLFTVVSKILQCQAPDLPPKVLIGACNLIVGATYQHLTNGVFVLRSTVLCSLLDLVVSRLNSLIPDQHRRLPAVGGNSNESLQSDSVADFAIETLFTLLSIVPDPFDGISANKGGVSLKESDISDITYRTQDVIAYLVSANVIDRLSVYCSSVQGPVDAQPGVANLLKISLDFLTALVWCLTFCLERQRSSSGGGKKEDPTQLLAALESSELAGSISMSYALLLYQGAPIRPRLTATDLEVVQNEEELFASSPPPPPGSRTASVLKSTLCLINAVARLDISVLQSVLGSEAMSLQFRHIASQLLWQVVPHREDRAMWGLLQELFIALGNYTVNNVHNQVTIQSGQAPTVLQQLCAVAKEFLTDLRLSRSILPTLIAATHGCQENRDLLVQENFPTDLLDGFLDSKFSYANVILKRLVGNPPGTMSGSNINNVNNINNNNNASNAEQHQK